MTVLTKREAASAIYVDFESLGKQINRPALLGMLVADEAGDRLRQFVLDNALSRAVVAKKDVCISTTTEEAVTAVVEEAEQHSRPV